MRVLRWTSLVIGTLALVLGVTVFGARYADGPIAVFPGGPFESGQWVEDLDVDWSIIRQVREVEIQSGKPQRSRTTWILVLNGQPYVPCSLGFPPFKRWHREAMKDPRAVLRVEGRRYRRTLSKVEDPELHQRLYEVLTKKYAGGPISGPTGVWFFRLDDPS